MQKLKKAIKRLEFSVFFLLGFISISLRAQVEDPAVWPKIIETKEYSITLYSPEDESYIDNKLDSYMAFSVKKENSEPVFGMLWVTSYLDVDRASRQASLASMKINEIRFPNEMPGPAAVA